jgi:hypothetical protein
MKDHQAVRVNVHCPAKSPGSQLQLHSLFDTLVRKGITRAHSLFPGKRLELFEIGGLVKVNVDLLCKGLSLKQQEANT